MYEESPRIFDALKAGACGYLLKRTQPAEIVEAIVQAHEGGSPMSPRIARQVVGFFKKSTEAAPLAPTRATSPQFTGLTDRECGVLDLLTKGYLYKEIGDQLGISPHTVSNHLRQIYGKLHVCSRAQAVAKYRGLA